MSALLALALQAAAAAPDWQPLGPAPGGMTFYDRAGIVILDAARRRVRIRDVYHQVRPNGAASSILSVELDCADRSGLLLEMQELDAAGAVIETWTIAPIRRRLGPEARGGPEEAQLLRMCGTPRQ